MVRYLYDGFKVRVKCFGVEIGQNLRLAMKLPKHVLVAI